MDILAENLLYDSRPPAVLENNGATEHSAIKGSLVRSLVTSVTASYRATVSDSVMSRTPQTEASPLLTVSGRADGSAWQVIRICGRLVTRSANLVDGTRKDQLGVGQTGSMTLDMP
jgi:hypothetical protein